MIFEPPYRQTVHYRELGDLPAGHPLAREWNTYRRELPRLLAEGLEGKWVLLRGDAVVGVFATYAEAVAEGDARFLLEPFMVRRVQEYEPVFRTSHPGVL